MPVSCILDELFASSDFLCGFFRIFYIEDNAICSRDSFTSLKANLDAFYFSFLPYCLG